MEDKKKTFIIKVFFFLILLCVLRMYILEHKEQPIEFNERNTVVDAYAKTQDNYFLFTMNGGIDTFPFLWSDALYLYDISAQKTYFVDVAKVPYESYRRYFIMNDRVYFEKSVMAETPDIIQKNLSTGKQYQLGLSSRNFIAVGESILYIGHEGEKRVLMSYENGKSKLLIPEAVEDIASTGTEVYWYNEDEKAVYEYKIDTNTSLRLSFINKWNEWIYKIDKSRYLFYDYEEEALYIGDVRTETKEKFMTLSDIDNAFYKNGVFYYNQGLSLLSLNLKSKEVRQIVDMNNYVNESVEQDKRPDIGNVQYCNDYIVVFAEGNFEQQTNNQNIFIFDYQGNQVHIEI